MLRNSVLVEIYLSNKKFTSALPATYTFNPCIWSRTSSSSFCLSVTRDFAYIVLFSLMDQYKYMNTCHQFYDNALLFVILFLYHLFYKPSFLLSQKEKSLHYFWSAISFSNTAILTTCVIVMLWFWCIQAAIHVLHHSVWLLSSYQQDFQLLVVPSLPIYHLHLNIVYFMSDIKSSILMQTLSYSFQFICRIPRLLYEMSPDIH